MAAATKPLGAPDAVTGEIATAVKHSFIYGFGGVLIKAAGFLLLPLYTHFLTPRDYGVFEVLELSVSLLSMFLNMGITAALLRYYGAAEGEAERRKVVGSIFLVTVATSAVVLGGASVSIRQVSALLLGSGVPATYLLVAVAACLLAYICNVPYTCLRAKEASGTVVLIDTGTTLGLYALNIYFVAVSKLAVFGMLLSRFIINVLSIGVLMKWTSRELFGGMDWKLLRRIIGFGAPLVFSNLTLFTLNFSDRFFLQRLQSLEIVGMYAVAYKFGFMLNFLLIQPFNMMWQARMYIIHRSPDHRMVFSTVFVLYSALLIFAGLGMAVLGPEAMRVMVDSRYAAGEAVIPVVSLAYVLLGIGNYLQLGILLKSRTGWIGGVSVLATAVNLGANYFLILHFGMPGAAWATVIGFLVIAVGSHCCSERIYPLSMPIGRVSKAVFWAIAAYGLSRILPSPSMAVGLLLKIALLLTFPILLVVSGYFSKHEIATLRSLGTGAFRPLRPAWLRG